MFNKLKNKPESVPAIEKINRVVRQIEMSDKDFAEGLVSHEEHLKLLNELSQLHLRSLNIEMKIREKYSHIKRAAAYVEEWGKKHGIEVGQEFHFNVKEKKVEVVEIQKEENVGSK